MTPLAATLKQLRAARGLSQRQLAEAAGIHRAIVQNIEQSLVARPRRHVLDALADALGVQPDALTTHVYEAPGSVPDADDDPDDGLSIGPRLRHWRETRGYSQALLADRAGLSRQGIQKMEGGSRHVKPSTVRKLAEALAITVDDLAPEFSPKPSRPKSTPRARRGRPLDPLMVHLAQAVHAYDPDALAEPARFASELGLGSTDAVAVLLSDGALMLLRRKQDWADYLVQHGDLARLPAALDALARVPDASEPSTSHPRHVAPSLRF